MRDEGIDEYGNEGEVEIRFGDEDDIMRKLNVLSTNRR